jgi:hypothetical protein
MRDHLIERQSPASKQSEEVRRKRLNIQAEQLRPRAEVFMKPLTGIAKPPPS